MNIIDLSNRNTTSRKTPEIDSLYVYSTRHKAKFTHRHQFGTGYKYTNHKAIMTAGEDEMHIYHRTVKIKGITKGLTMVTKNSKFREVQKFFKEQIAVIEEDDKLFEIFSKASATPVEIGILYTWI